MQNVIPKLYLIGSFLSSISCVSRADYNFPIFLFSYIAWIYMNVNLKELKDKCYIITKLFNFNRYYMVHCYLL